MQDEVNQKVVTLCINGGKISTRILKNALVKLLRKMEQMKREQRQAARTSRQQKEVGGIPRKTKYGKADETELSAYQYRSDGR